MSRLSLQKNILYFPIAVAVNGRIGSNRSRRKLPLHDPGFSGIAANVIQIFRLHQILANRLPIEENNRNLLRLRHADDIGRHRSIHQIDTEDITAGIQKLFHAVIFCSLHPCTVPDRNGDVPVL